MWSLTINLAGLGVQIEADAGLVPFLLQEPLARFATNLPADLTINLAVTPPETWSESAARAVYQDEVVRFEFNNLRGVLDRRSRHMVGQIPTPELASAAMRRMLMVAGQYVLLDAAGLLLRAAAVEIGETCLIFPGPSGAGKTTLMHLALDAGLRVLGDEAILLRRQGQTWQAYSFPYWEPGVTTRRAEARPLSGQVGGLVEPVQAAECQVTRLSVQKMLLHLMATENVLLTTAAESRRWLHTAHNLIEEVSLFQLRFRPTTEVWSILRAAVSASP